MIKQDRVFSIDLARGGAAFFLVAVHTLWMYGSADVQFSSGFGRVAHTLGQATAFFLLTMGFSIVVTPHQSLRYSFKRALFILSSGYLLNTLKFIVPITVFGTMPEEFIAAYGWQSPLNIGQLRYLFLTGDILQMTGISFAIIGLVRHFIKDKYTVLMLAFLIIGIYPFIKGFRPGIYGVDYLCDLLWGDQWNVYFPVFPWISNIFVGMFMGMYFQDKQEGEVGLYKSMLLVGIPCLIVGGGLCYYDWKTHFNDFFHPGHGGALLALGASLCGFYIFGRTISVTLSGKEKFRRIILYLSSRVTSIYIVQWTLVCWGMGIVGYQTLNMEELLILIPLMMVLTLLLDYAYMHLRRLV
ncbi:MAG: DUF1624 domain-containing protein [Gammaproteobacteria bacterium]|nr:DUF1624 domain-containing protein [Gammaproteobacteria bacterium]